MAAMVQEGGSSTTAVAGSTAEPAGVVRVGPPIERPAADQFMRRLLRIAPDRPKGSRADADRAFSTSILVSAVRCVLTYIVLPFVAPALGIAKDVGPWVGIPIGLVAILCNILSMRRFWAADHKWRWGYTAIATVVIGLLLVLMAADVAELLG
jgi:hypothetical protein